MNRRVMCGLGMSLCFLLACGGGQSTSTVTSEVPTAERQQQDSSSKKRSRVIEVALEDQSARELE